MMKEISEKAVLSTVYTNHCVRATAITLWSEAGLADRHTCHISGHRNPNSLHRQLSSESAVMFCHLLYRQHRSKQMSSQQFQSVSSRQPREMSSTVAESHRPTSSNTAVILMAYSIGLITVFDAILTSRQTRLK